MAFENRQKCIHLYINVKLPIGLLYRRLAYNLHIAIKVNEFPGRNF